MSGAEAERDQGRDRGAEDEQQDDQQEGQRDQLAALGGVDRLVLDRPREGRETRLGGADRRADVVGEDLLDFGDGVVDRGFDVDVEVGEDQRLAGARTKGGDHPPVPGREGVDLGIAPQCPNQCRALAVDRGRGTAQEDREGGGVAEILAQDLVGSRGLGAGHVERGRVEPVLDPGPEHPQHDQDDGRDREHDPRVAHGPGIATAGAGVAWVYVSPAPPPSHAW